jgi:hypothetical protein
LPCLDIAVYNGFYLEAAMKRIAEVGDLVEYKSGGEYRIGKVLHVFEGGDVRTDTDGTLSRNEIGDIVSTHLPKPQDDLDALDEGEVMPERDLGDCGTKPYFCGTCMCNDSCRTYQAAVERWIEDD